MREKRIDAESASRAAPMIDIADLSYAVGGTCLLDIPELALKRDGITVVMGPNGAGKSLLLRLLHGLIAPTAGRILWDGEDLNAETRKRQALVFQTPVLLRRSVAANVDFVLKARGKPRALRGRMLARVDLADHANRPARRLAGGEQQRLAIARALATEPEVLFLDEPTASLDPGSVQAIERIVRQTAAAGVRVVFVTHDIGQARRLADDVIFLAGGRLAEQSSAEAFFQGPQSQVARAYLAGQLDQLVEN